ncbi:MAG: Dabb family protein [Alphaproteobacteria bacterium]
MHDELSKSMEEIKLPGQHIVLVEFNDGVAEDAKMAALQSVHALQGKIEGTHSVIVTMRDKRVLAEYGPHPAHKEVQSIIGPIVKTLWVVDS